MRRTVQFALLAVVALGLVHCGPTSTERVTVVAPEGAEIVVPEGVDASSLSIQGAGKAFTDPAFVAIGAGYACGPAGASFPKPVTLRIPYDPALLATLKRKSVELGVYTRAGGQERFTALTTRVDVAAHFVEADVSHFSDFQVGVHVMNECLVDGQVGDCTFKVCVLPEFIWTQFFAEEPGEGSAQSALAGLAGSACNQANADPTAALATLAQLTNDLQAVLSGGTITTFVYQEILRFVNDAVAELQGIPTVQATGVWLGSIPFGEGTLPLGLQLHQRNDGTLLGYVLGMGGSLTLSSGYVASNQIHLVLASEGATTGAVLTFDGQVTVVEGGVDYLSGTVCDHGLCSNALFTKTGAELVERRFLFADEEKHEPLSVSVVVDASGNLLAGSLRFPYCEEGSCFGDVFGLVEGDSESGSATRLRLLFGSAGGMAGWFDVDFSASSASELGYYVYRGEWDLQGVEQIVGGPVFGFALPGATTSHVARTLEAFAEVADDLQRRADFASFATAGAYEPFDGDYLHNGDDLNAPLLRFAGFEHSYSTITAEFGNFANLATDANGERLLPGLLGAPNVHYSAKVTGYSPSPVVLLESDSLPPRDDFRFLSVDDTAGKIRFRGNQLGHDSVGLPLQADLLENGQGYALPYGINRAGGYGYSDGIKFVLPFEALPPDVLAAADSALVGMFCEGLEACQGEPSSWLWTITPAYSLDYNLSADAAGPIALGDAIGSFYLQAGNPSTYAMEFQTSVGTKRSFCPYWILSNDAREGLVAAVSRAVYVEELTEPFVCNPDRQGVTTFPMSLTWRKTTNFNPGNPAQIRFTRSSEAVDVGGHAYDYAFLDGSGQTSATGYVRDQSSSASPDGLQRFDLVSYQGPTAHARYRIEAVGATSAVMYLDAVGTARLDLYEAFVPGTESPCNDWNPCTDDAELAGGECTHASNHASCLSAQGCTTGDRCDNGYCHPGALMDCDDDDPCTMDSCAPQTGLCAHVPSGTCCVPDCANKACGDDGCGGSCGTCSPGATCNLGQCGWGCVPNCTGKQCGSDGCTGTCGTCTPPSMCDYATGQCVPSGCIPSCGARQCGSDGCTGTCGTCTAPNTCNYETGMCVPSGCIPSCGARQCGSDGCTGTCGTCTGPNTCNYETGMCVPSGCVPDCTGMECGPDTCGGECGTCTGGSWCDFGRCVGECLPDCYQRTCGDDGCSGSCGTCTASEACSPQGLCVDECLDLPSSWAPAGVVDTFSIVVDSATVEAICPDVSGDGIGDNALKTVAGILNPEIAAVLSDGVPAIAMELEGFEAGVSGSFTVSVFLGEIDPETNELLIDPKWYTPDACTPRVQIQATTTSSGWMTAGPGDVPIVVAYEDVVIQATIRQAHLTGQLVSTAEGVTLSSGVLAGILIKDEIDSQIDSLGVHCSGAVPPSYCLYLPMLTELLPALIYDLDLDENGQPDAGSACVQVTVSPATIDGYAPTAVLRAGAATLTVPVGIPAEDVTFAQVAEVDGGVDFIPVGPGYDCGPDGAVFERPLMVRIPYDPNLVDDHFRRAQDIRVFTNTPEGRYMALPTVVNEQENYVEAQLYYSSTVAAGVSITFGICDIAGEIQKSALDEPAKSDLLARAVLACEALRDGDVAKARAITEGIDGDLDTVADKADALVEALSENVAILLLPATDANDISGTWTGPIKFRGRDRLHTLVLVQRKDSGGLAYDTLLGYVMGGTKFRTISGGYAFANDAATIVFEMSDATLRRTIVLTGSASTSGGPAELTGRALIFESDLLTGEEYPGYEKTDIKLVRVAPNTTYVENRFTIADPGFESPTRYEADVAIVVDDTSGTFISGGFVATQDSEASVLGFPENFALGGGVLAFERGVTEWGAFTDICLGRSTMLKIETSGNDGKYCVLCFDTLNPFDSAIAGGNYRCLDMYANILGQGTIEAKEAIGTDLASISKTLSMYSDAPSLCRALSRFGKQLALTHACLRNYS